MVGRPGEHYVAADQDSLVRNAPYYARGGDALVSESTGRPQPR